MKRLFSILFCCFSVVVCFGQNLKDDAEWIMLIDYVNAQYVQSYCEKRCAEGLPVDDVNKYNEHIKNELEGKGLGEALSQSELEDILKKNGFNKAFTKVVEPLQKKYAEEKTNRSLKKALDISILDKDIIKYLEDTQSELTKKMESHYISAPKSSAPVNPSPVATAAKKSKSKVDGWKVISLLELLIIAIMFVIMWLRTSGERIMEVVLRSGKMEDMYVTKRDVEISMPKRDLMSRIERLETQVGDIKNELVSRKPGLLVGQNVEYRKQEPVTPSVPPQPIFAPVFVKNFGNGLFRVAESSDAQFRLDLSNESTAKFVFCGDESKALANSDGTFDYVCDLDGSAADAKKVVTIAPGQASKQADGKWRVIIRARISLE